MDEMTLQRAGRQQNLLAWSQHVADCRSSGLSVNRWCAEHNIRPKTYYNWQKEVRQITPQQYRWLMEGLKVEQPKAHRPVEGLSIA